MYDVCDIDTGEVVMTCSDFDHRWYDEGKRRVKKELKNMGYKVVNVEYNKRGLTVWVEKEEKNMYAVELRTAINYGKETIEEYKKLGRPIPTWATERMIELYEELIEAISVGEE